MRGHILIQAVPIYSAVFCEKHLFVFFFSLLIGGNNYFIHSISLDCLQHSRRGEEGGKQDPLFLKSINSSLFLSTVDFRPSFVENSSFCSPHPPII